jgi:hypothetical protein
MGKLAIMNGVISGWAARTAKVSCSRIAKNKTGIRFAVTEQGRSPNWDNMQGHRTGSFSMQFANQSVDRKYRPSGKHEKVQNQ